MTTYLELNATHLQLSAEELCQSANISPQTLLTLVEYDIAVPIGGSQPMQWVFQLSAVTRVQKATRLAHDLVMEWADLSLVMQLLDEIEQLRSENTQLKQRLARYGWSE